jgi:VCBS repeat-containing protein
LVGSFTQVNGQSRNNLARLNPDGSLDTAFLDGMSGANGPVAAVLRESSEKILIGGNFTAVNGVPVGRVARLYIGDPNAAPTDILLSNDAVTEIQPIGTMVGTLSAVDPDIGDTHSFALVEGPGDEGNGRFAIFGSELRTAEFLRWDLQSSHEIRVRATDEEGASFEKSFVIGVEPINHPPVAVDDSYATDQNTVLRVKSPGILENDSLVGSGGMATFRFEGEMRSTDADFTFGERFIGYYQLDPWATGINHPASTLNLQYPSPAAHWEIQFPDSGYHFKGVQTTISAGNNTDFGDRYIVNLLNPVSAGVALASARQLSFAQVDLQDPYSAGADLLEDDTIQAASVALALAQTSAGRLLFMDNSQPQIRLTRLIGPLTVVSVNGDAVQVNNSHTLPSGAILHVHQNGYFSYDPNGQFSHLPEGATATDAFAYEVSGPHGASAYAYVSITIHGFNDPPVDLELTQNAVLERQPAGALVGFLEAVDPDVGDAHLFSLVSGEGDEDNGWFYIDGDRLRTAAVFDAARRRDFGRPCAGPCAGLQAPA